MKNGLTFVGALTVIMGVILAPNWLHVNGLIVLAAAIVILGAVLALVGWDRG